MIGLANMAARLAYQRKKSGSRYQFVNPKQVSVEQVVAREHVKSDSQASGEYYRIIDRITRGEKP